eukprot:gene10917-12077_t
MARNDNTEVEILDHRLVAELNKDEHVDMDFYTACMIGDYSTVRKFVSDAKDLNKKNRNGGWTGLMYAAFIGRDTIVNMLLEASVDVNAITSKNGTTALMLASNCGNESVAYFLIQQRANVNIRDKKGENALFHAVEGGHINVVKMLLDCDADIEASQTYTKLTPLMVAAIEGHAVIFSMLLEYGANLNARSQVGDTAYNLAMNNGNITIINVIENLQRKNKSELLREEAGLFDNVGIRDGPERIAILTQQARELSLHQGSNDKVRTRDMVPPIDARDYEPIEDSWSHTDLVPGDPRFVNEKVYSQSDGAQQALKGDISQTIVIPTRKKVSRICKEPPKQAVQVQDQYSSVTVESVASILHELKLTKYSSCFEAECVGIDTFFTLTDDDLKQIGIDKLGPRKKILSFISKFAKSKGGDDLHANQDADSAIQEAHAFVEYLQAQVYKERQGRHELESYFIAERNKMDKIIKNVKHLHRLMDDIKINTESLRSLSSNCVQKVSNKDGEKLNEREAFKIVDELRNETLKIIDKLTSKILPACQASDNIVTLCSEDYNPENH